jgi:guanylate kinase
MISPRSPLVLLISAPSGGGKTTVCTQLLASNPGLSRAITCTTRPPRTGERDGVDYHFLDPTVFARRVAAGEFLEHATVYGQSYGTLKAELFERWAAGQDVLLNIDVQGAASVRAQAAQDSDLSAALVSVFLTPDSLATLEERLRRRAQDAEAVIQRRIATARTEIQHWRQFDYLVISTTIPEDLRQVQAIYTAEKLRTRRSRGALNDDAPVP